MMWPAPAYQPAPPKPAVAAATAAVTVKEPEDPVAPYIKTAGLATLGAKSLVLLYAAPSHQGCARLYAPPNDK
jgi:hypothetical protein